MGLRGRPSESSLKRPSLPSLNGDSVWQHDDDDDSASGCVSVGTEDRSSSDQSSSHNVHKSYYTKRGTLEQQRIFYAKLGIMCVLVVSAIVLSAVAYTFTRKVEERDFQDAVSST